MILDRENLFSNAQAVTVTAKSTDTVDLGPRSHARNSQGQENGLEIFAHVNTTFTAAGAGTLTIELRSSQNSDMSSPVVHGRSDTLALADLVAGNRIRFVPRLPIDAGRYFDLNYVVATGPMTAGAITAGIVASRQTNV